MSDYPLISIVIPFFNRESTLKYCVNSILNQEYENWELILVDDGSNDNSALVCKAFVASDSRIKYFYQKNQGAGPARNLGIEHASGNWITFVDSDDAIMPNHLTQLVDYGDNCDLVMVNRGKGMYCDGKLIVAQNKDKQLQSFELCGNREIVDFMYGQFDPYNHANYACWDKFFKMAVIKMHNLRYPVDVPTGQDQVFVVNYYKYVQHMFYSSKCTYIPTPMGNEGIEHLACRLRQPNEFFHCQHVNYRTLLELAEITNSENVRRYAINYILSKPLERIVLPYTHWRNRRILGKKAIVDFVNVYFLPLIKQLENNIDDVKSDVYRKNLHEILEGHASAIYDKWFYHFLKEDLKSAIIRRWKRIVK